jgi:hypothetical protein
MSVSFYRKTRSLFAFMLFLAAWPTTSASGQRTIEVYGGIGYTAVDLDAWTQTRYVDWNQTMYQGSVQAFIAQAGTVLLGVEIGYDYFFWYTVPVPGYSYTRTREADATRLMAVARLEAPTGLFGEFGAGGFLFGDWTDLGVAASVGYKIRATPKIAVPIKLRSAYIMDADANLLPVGISVGVAVGF